MSEQNKTIVRRFFAAFATNDQTTLTKLLTPDFVFHHTSGSINRETQLQGINMLGAAFSDFQVTIKAQIAEGNTVATHLTWQAIHSGNFQGHPPTNKEIEVSAISIERIEDGRIAERWFIQEKLGLMVQLGVLPPLG